MSNAPGYVNEIQEVPKYPKVMWYHTLNFKIYNFIRRPLVKRKQIRVSQIAQELKEKVDKYLIPLLAEKANHCGECKNNYAALEQQAFTSSIEFILTKCKCPKHLKIYHDFLINHRHLFEESERLARWINGFN